MYTLALIVLLLMSPQNIYGDAPQAQPNLMLMTVSSAGHEATVVISSRPFDPTAHSISDSNTSSGVLLVDGRKALGSSTLLPHSEIERFEFTLDGVSVVVPSELYQDCFNLQLVPEASILTLADSGTAAMFSIVGGDGEAFYRVLFVLRTDGAHSRFTLDCSDCSDSLSEFDQVSAAAHR